MAKDKPEKPDNKLPLRPSLMIHAYLADLADWGTFGKGKTGVEPRFTITCCRLLAERPAPYQGPGRPQSHPGEQNGGECVLLGYTPCGS